MKKNKIEKKKRINEKRKLPVMGGVLPFDVHLAAYRSALDPIDLERLLKWRRAKKDRSKRLLWEAAVEGVRDRIWELYLARWAKAHKKPVSAWREMRGVKKHFWEAAIGILEQGQTPERLLDVAEDMIPAYGRKLKYPMPSHLAGPYVQQALQEWVPPEEREESFLSEHPERLKEATEAHRKATEKDRKKDPWIEIGWGMAHIDFASARGAWSSYGKRRLGEHGSASAGDVHGRSDSNDESRLDHGGLQVDEEGT